MIITRVQESKIRKAIGNRKAIVVIGPRQVGKTTLVREIAESLEQKLLWLTGDDPETRAFLNNISLANLKTMIGNSEIVVVDEAQRLTNAGLTLKLITDQMPQVQLFVTGSSALDLAAQTKENLTGRKLEFPLLPISFVEMCDYHGFLTEKSLLEHRLLFGYYPESVKNEPEQAKIMLADLADGLMYKDLLTLDQIKKPSLLVKLLQALALQIGSEVNYHELAQWLGADAATVEKYIDLLEQSFVLFRLPSLSRNARNEIKKGRKIYFFDLGIRNAIIKNFAPIALRNDVGALWENFLIVERRKSNLYSSRFCNTFFWRTTAQQEIDYVEESDGQLMAFEFKWQAKKSVLFPKTFLNAYPNCQTALIDRNNFAQFLGIV